jgi:hypothetical protein
MYRDTHSDLLSTTPRGEVRSIGISRQQIYLWSRDESKSGHLVSA